MSHYKLWRIEYAFFSEEPYKFEYIWDTQRLMKNSPIISWDMYIDYLRIEQKRHPEEQPEIYIDEVMAIQTDSGIGKALMKYVLGLDMTSRYHMSPIRWNISERGRKNATVLLSFLQNFTR